MSLRCTERGVSLIEILVALTILSIGLLGVVGASAMVNRMLGQGRSRTVVMAYAELRLELLRAAARDSAGCASLAGGSATLPSGMTERWSVSPGIRSAGIAVIISRGALQADTLSTVIPCL